MKKLPFLAFICALFLSTSVLAQDNFREVGMSLGDDFSIAFIYKKQKAENRYISYDALFGNAGLIHFDNRTIASAASLGLTLTFEKRKDITEKMQFIHGWSPGISSEGRFTDSTDQNDRQVTVTPQLGYRLGLLYQFSDLFYATVQGRIASSATMVFSDNPDARQTTFGLGFDQNDVRLTLVYRFRKKEK